MGAIKFPKNIPNLNQILFKGVNSFEFAIPNIKKISDIIKDHSLISFSFNIGQMAIIKKTTKKTIPKFLFVGNFIFGCIFYFTIFFLRSKALISSFHSLFDKPEESISTFFPEIRSFKTNFPLDDISVPPTL